MAHDDERPATEQELALFKLGIHLGLNIAGGILMALDASDPVRASRASAKSCARLVQLLEELPDVAETLARDALRPDSDQDDYEETMERYLRMVIDSIPDPVKAN